MFDVVGRSIRFPFFCYLLIVELIIATTYAVFAPVVRAITDGLEVLPRIIFFPIAFLMFAAKNDANGFREYKASLRPDSVWFDRDSAFGAIRDFQVNGKWDDRLFKHIFGGLLIMAMGYAVVALLR